MKASQLKPDIELQGLLKGKISVGSTEKVAIYTNGERSGAKTPDDFIDISYSGSLRFVDTPMSYIKGYLSVSLFVKLNPDGTTKTNRIAKILSQLDDLINRKASEHYYYEYMSEDFMTPTTAYTSIGYSMTTLALRWHTK